MGERVRKRVKEKACEMLKEKAKKKRARKRCGERDGDNQNNVLADARRPCVGVLILGDHVWVFCSHPTIT